MMKKTAGKFINNKKGFTLAEVIIAMSIVVILIAISSVMIISSLNTFARSTRLDQAKQVGSAVYNYYENRLSYASGVSVQTGTGSKVLTVNDGRMMYYSVGSSPENAYGEDFYNNFDISVTSSVSEGYIMNISVDVYDSGELLYTRSRSFRLETIKRNGESAAGTLSTLENAVIYIVE